MAFREIAVGRRRTSSAFMTRGRGGAIAVRITSAAAATVACQRLCHKVIPGVPAVFPHAIGPPLPAHENDPGRQGCHRRRVALVRLVRGNQVT